MTPTPPLLCPQSREFAAPPKAPSAEPSFSGYDCAQAPCGSPARWPAAAAPESETEVGPGPAAHEIAFLCAARRRGPRGVRTGGDGCGSPRGHPCSCSWAPQAPVPQTATPGAPPASRGPPQGAPHTAMGRNSGQEPTGRTEGTVPAPETQRGRAGSLPATLSLTLLPQGPPRAVYGLRTESPPHGLWIQGPERGGDWPGSLLGNGLTGRSTDWARPTHFEMGTSGPVQTGRHDGGGLSSPRMGVQPRIHTGAGDPLGWRVLTVLRGGWATSGLGRCPAPPPAWSRAPPGPGPSRPCSLGYQFSSVFLAIFSTVGKDWTQDLV